MSSGQFVMYADLACTSTIVQVRYTSATSGIFCAENRCTNGMLQTCATTPVQTIETMQERAYTLAEADWAQQPYVVIGHYADTACTRLTGAVSVLLGACIVSGLQSSQRFVIDPRGNVANLFYNDDRCGTQAPNMLSPDSMPNVNGACRPIAETQSPDASHSIVFAVMGTNAQVYIGNAPQRGAVAGVTSDASMLTVTPGVIPTEGAVITKPGGGVIGGPGSGASTTNGYGMAAIAACLMTLLMF